MAYKISIFLTYYNTKNYYHFWGEDPELIQELFNQGFTCAELEEYIYCKDEI